ncbi:MAG: dTMP kinase [Candidatus Acidiferrales bacterium]
MTEPTKPEPARGNSQEVFESVPESETGQPWYTESIVTRASVGLPTRDRSALSGHLIVLEGTDGSGRSTQIALLTEWLESQGFAVQTMGLRRSFLIAKDIDSLLAKNSVTRYTLALMYATDFFDQLENRILPALRSGMIVLADRYYYTLIVRAAVRGLDHDYLHRIYDLALPPDLTFFLNVRPQISFEREFQKSPAISFWEAGRDLHLSDDLYDSFIGYQTMIRKEFVALAKHHGFATLNGENSIRMVNADLRKRVASYLGIRNIRYRPSHALVHLWQ